MKRRARVAPGDNSRGAREIELARARQFLEAVVAHDFDSAEELLDPDVETVTPRGSLRGIAACRQVLQKASGDEQFALHQGARSVLTIDAHAMTKS